MSVTPSRNVIPAVLPWTCNASPHGWLQATEEAHSATARPNSASAQWGCRVLPPNHLNLLPFPPPHHSPISLTLGIDNTTFATATSTPSPRPGILEAGDIVFLCRRRIERQTRQTALRHVAGRVFLPGSATTLSTDAPRVSHRLFSHSTAGIVFCWLQL